MKQTRPVTAPARARLAALTRHDLGAVAGGANGTIIIEHRRGISGGAVVPHGVGGTGLLPDG